MTLSDRLHSQAQRNEARTPEFPGQSLRSAILGQSDDGPLMLTAEMRGAAIRATEAPILDDPRRRTEFKGTQTRTARLDQMTFAIDYRDFSGAQTRRPVTILSISAPEGAPILEAFCHLRQANRSFRVDRIDCVINEDGEVFDPATFFRETFAIDLRAFAKADDQDDPLLGARQVRDALRPMLSILVLAARADGHYHAEELDVILRYAERELIEMERLGRLVAPITPEMLDQLTPIIRQMRPTTEPLGYYVERVAGLALDARRRFWRALEDVMGADGEWTDDESDFFDMVKGKGER